ncbi:hypothetical protein U1Q18_031393 [Sarracenia purpurea var. burkii]
MRLNFLASSYSRYGNIGRAIKTRTGSIFSSESQKANVEACVKGGAFGFCLGFVFPKAPIASNLRSDSLCVSRRIRVQLSLPDSAGRHEVWLLRFVSSDRHVVRPSRPGSFGRRMTRLTWLVGRGLLFSHAREHPVTRGPLLARLVSAEDRRTLGVDRRMPGFLLRFRFAICLRLRTLF